jgi:signal transduction histidine kinase
VDLNAVVREVVRGSETVAREKGLALRAAVEDRAAVARLNDSGIRRLLIILIENAIRHTAAGGSVTVATARRDGGIALTVEDTGEGIAPQALPHIFERFYCGDPARTGGGAGLGLSIAQAIAHAHRSEIAVDSEPGGGARFTVVLPK